jgi:hypothetical protein
MATEAIPKIDAFSVAAAAESANQERGRDRAKPKAAAKPKPAPLPESPAAEVPPVADALSTSQYVDSSTVVELLAHRPSPSPQARFLSPARPKASSGRRISDGKKLDKSA